MDFSLILFIVGSALIFLGSNLLVDNSKLIANSLGISPLVIGLTIIAFGTSLPELVVSILASFKEQSDIVIGNVMGSNISNVALVLAIIIIMKPIPVNRTSLSGNFKYLYISTAIFIFILLYNYLGLYSGLVLLLLFILFIKNQIKEIDKTVNTYNDRETPFRYNHILFILLGIIMLGCGSELFINGAIGIATYFGIPLIVISLSVVAFGTSLPELITSIVAIKKDEPGFVIGNILGSNIINIVLVLGTSIIINPINVSFDNIKISIFILILTTAIFTFICFNKQILRRNHGVLLLVIYLIFIYFNFMNYFK